MKKVYLLWAFALLLRLSAFAQAPEKLSYQAVIRDNSNNLVASQSIGMQISILQGSASGTPVYTETQSPNSNANGLVSIEIGTGAVVLGDFSYIDWSSSSFFIKTEIDITGGSNYNIIGTSQLLSVPFALYAKTSGGVAGNQWDTNGNNVYNTNTGSVVVGSSYLSNSNLNFLVTSNTTPKAAIGYQGGFNNINSGELHFVEDTNFNDECGIKFQHNGTENNLYLIGACPIPDTIARFNRNGYSNMKKLKLGLNYNNYPTTELSVDGLSDFNGNVTITGDLNVTGNITKGGGTFRIDHPLDPKNKYLIHSFIESPDMLNIYTGNATTNESGIVTVTLPSYFEAANKDFRYQLTTIGTFAQAIIKEKVSGNKFVIQTSTPNVEVSWQVTATRADRYANEYRIVPEKEKDVKGSYLHPNLYGLGDEASESHLKSVQALKKTDSKSKNFDKQ